MHDFYSPTFRNISIILNLNLKFQKRGRSEEMTWISWIFHFSANFQPILFWARDQTRRLRPQIPDGRSVLHLGPDPRHCHPEEARANQPGKICKSSHQRKTPLAHLPQSHRVFRVEQKPGQVHQTHSTWPNERAGCEGDDRAVPGGRGLPEVVGVSRRPSTFHATFHAQTRWQRRSKQRRAQNENRSCW